MSVYGTIYFDKWEAIRKVKAISISERQKLACALLDYACFGEEPDYLSNTAKGFFELMKTSTLPSGERRKRGGQPGNTNAKRIQNEYKNECKNENLPMVYTECIPEKKPEPETKTEIYNPPISPPRGSRDVGFQLFWEEYPKKVGKLAAQKAFEKARKKVPIEDIVLAISRQKGSNLWRKDNGAYIPNPATWLNQGRWADEVAEAEQEQPKPKPIPKVSQCPQCGGYDLKTSYNRLMCRVCGAMYEYSHAKGKWERV